MYRHDNFEDKSFEEIQQVFENEKQEISRKYLYIYLGYTGLPTLITFLVSFNFEATIMVLFFTHFIVLPHYFAIKIGGRNSRNIFDIADLEDESKPIYSWEIREDANEIKKALYDVFQKIKSGAISKKQAGKEIRAIKEKLVRKSKDYSKLKIESNERDDFYIT